MPSADRFFDLYQHGFVRVAVATASVRIGDPTANVESTIALMREAARRKAIVCMFPELGLSAYTCEDLFHQQALLQSVNRAFEQLLRATRTVPVAMNQAVAGGGIGVLWGLLAAIETLFLIPVFLVTFFLQNHLLRGVTFGTVKR